MSGLHEFKVILVGEINVGKTSLIIRFTDKKFHETTKSTINVDIKTVFLSVNGEECLMHIFDTGGQETFHSLGSSFFRNAVGVIFVYDETKPETFDKISTWFQCVEDICDEGVIKILAGNKADETEKKRVLSSRVKSFAQGKNVEVFKTSAKTDTNVKEVFLRLIELIVVSKEIVPAGTKPVVEILETPDDLLKAMEESKKSYVKERRSRFVEKHSKRLKGIQLFTPSGLKVKSESAEAKSEPVEVKLETAKKPEKGGCSCTLL